MLISALEAFDALKSPEPHLRREAARFFTDHPTPEASDALLTALGDPDPHTHEAIIIALVHQTADERIPRLIAVLREDHPVRRNAALSALIEIGAHNASALMHALNHASTEVRLHIATILGDLRHAPTTAALIQRLDDPDEFPNVRHAAAQALGKIGDRAATPALLNAAERGDFWVRYAAVEALGRLGDRRSINALLRLLKDDSWMRPATVRALGDIGQPEAIPALVHALSDTNDAVRAAAVEALLKIVVEPVTATPIPEERQRETRLMIPVAPLLRELNARLAPGSAQAAHLIGWLTPPEALPELIRTLGLEDETLRHAAAESILRYGRSSIPLLLGAVNNPNPLVRENAVELLGMLPTPVSETVARLTPLLNDPCVPVRHAALRALGSLGDEAAYAGLLQALDDSASRDVATSILAKVQDAAFIEQLQRALYQAPLNIRRAAAYTLSQIGDETAVSILLNAIRLPDEKVRLAASEALGQVQSARAVAVLIEALGDRDALVRQKAIEALSNQPDSRVIPALLPLVSDPEWRVRKALASTLVRLGDPRIYPVLQQLAQDPNRWIRRTTMDLVGMLEDARATDLLRRGARDGDPGVRRAALVSIGRRRDPHTLEMIVACFQDLYPSVRLEAIRAWALIGHRKGLDELVSLMEDAQEEVRRETADALGEFGTDEAMALLERLLRDDSKGVRASAAQALGALNSQRAVEILAAAMSHPNARIQAQDQLMQLGSLSVRVLLSMARASEVELRLEAASALGALKSKDAQPTLRMLAQDPDPRVSEAATEALKAMGVEA